jgi:NAD(P)-dependent dehydrogenase (short-subunit alcohol dehydrogenase family)
MTDPTPTALVTGATSGIGRSIAMRLAADGAHVIVSGRDADRGAALVDRLGSTARFVPADLEKPEEALRLAEEAGEVDLLINAAGFYAFADTPSTNAVLFDRHMAVNARAPFLLVGAIAPAMAARGSGVIITVTSNAATSPAPIGGAYGASKAAVELLTRSWATEFGLAGVRVNAVSPGPVRTEGTERMLGEHIAMLDSGTGRGRAAHPDEIADVVAFLAGPASSYLNGSIVLADGGPVSALPR